MIWAIGAILGLGSLAVAEGILLYGRIRLLIDHAEKLLAVGQDNVAKLPSKSAGRDQTIKPKPKPDDAPTGPIATPTVPAAAVIEDWRAQFTFKERQ